jgi:hypothetical protein
VIGCNSAAMDGCNNIVLGQFTGIMGENNIVIGTNNQLYIDNKIMIGESTHQNITLGALDITFGTDTIILTYNGKSITLNLN